MAAAASGVLATLSHDAIMTPMDTIKQRLQLGYYRGIRHCVQQMIRYEVLVLQRNAFLFAFIIIKILPHCPPPFPSP